MARYVSWLRMVTQGHCHFSQTVYAHDVARPLVSQYRSQSSFTDVLLNSDLRKEYFTFRFVKSSGPGGQSVNKLNTKVELRFSPSRATWLAETTRLKLIEIVQSRLNSNGELIVTSDKYKSQAKNVEDAMDKVETLIQQASYVAPEPTEEQKAKVRKLMRIHNEKRLLAKKRHSESKRERKVIDLD